MLFPNVRYEGLAGSKGPGGPFVSLTGTSGPSQLLNSRGSLEVKAEGPEHAWAAGPCGPSCRCFLDPMAQYQASRWGDLPLANFSVESELQKPLTSVGRPVEASRDRCVVR